MFGGYIKVKNFVPRLPHYMYEQIKLFTQITQGHNLVMVTKLECILRQNYLHVCKHVCP